MRGTPDMPVYPLSCMHIRVSRDAQNSNLSPAHASALAAQVDNYASHSVITNSWCVQAKWDLDPGDVYSVIAVMAEPTTHEVPLRLTVFYPPELEKASIISKPLSPLAEYFCSAVKGVTDSSGFVSLELMPQVGVLTDLERAATNHSSQPRATPPVTCHSPLRATRCDCPLAVTAHSL